MSKTALYIISDRHAGHVHGLTSPHSELKEMVPMKGKNVYSKVNLNAVQQAVWQVTSEARKWGGYNLQDYDKYLIDLGEVIQGNQYPDDLMTDKLHEQRKLSRDAVEPFLELSGMKGARIYYATPWHDGGAGDAPETIADELQQSYLDLDIRAQHKSIINIDGFRLQFFHTGPSPGKRFRLQPNGAYWAAHDLILRNTSEGEPIPDLVVTAHNHLPSRAKPYFFIDGDWVGCEWMTTPPLCGPGAFSRKVANPDYFYCGMSVVRIVDGKLYDIETFSVKLYDYIREAW